MRRTQSHSTIPSGSFNLQLAADSTNTYSVDVPYNSGRGAFRKLLQSLSPSITVDIGRSSGNNNFVWSITFITPRGVIPTMSINASNVIGDNVVASIIKIQNGSAKSLWFDPIPAWMTEVPLQHVSNNSLTGNIEVYVQSDSGDVIKSVCDSTGDSGYGVADSFLKGNEMSCGFLYDTNLTALISNFSLAYLDEDYTKVIIDGNYFLLDNTKTKLDVTVTISDHNCNITFVNDQHIECIVSSVPWGSHAPVVNIKGSGNAMLVTNKKLNFKQSVYSIYPAHGSFAGGTIISIKGRGFRPTVSVTFIDIVDECEVISWSSTEILCRTPASNVIHTSFPSSQPSSSPSYLPSESPTDLPSSHPSQIPSLKPSTQVDYQPSSQPSDQPQVDPSVLPSEYPVTSPTAVPNIIPSGSPSHIPSSKPSDNPLHSPTSQPFDIPSSNPSSKPISLPTSLPLNLPTSTPSDQPVCLPTSQPFNVPYSHPTCPPSCIPFSLPTTIPSTVPSISNSPVIRRRLSDHQSNTFSLYVDGFNSSLTFTYDIADTPIVKSISPLSISSSITTNLSILISNYGNLVSYTNISVTVGSQNCQDVSLNPGGVLACNLIRSPSLSFVSTVFIKIYFPGKGYAGVENNINGLPTAIRGYKLIDINPKYGSVMGGNELTIKGFGFDPKYISKYTVQLSMLNLQPLNDYDLLLQSLGFPINTTRTSDQIINCTIVSLNNTEMVVLVPSHQITYASNNYTVQVTINGITAACYNLNNCTYTQDLSHSPVIGESVRVKNFTELGEYYLEIDIYKLENELFTVSVGSYECTILSVTDGIDSNTSEPIKVIYLLTPPLPAGKLSIGANIATKGDAISYAELSVSLFLKSVYFDTSKGSLAGGTKITLTGRGFSPSCGNNMILLDLTDISNSNLFSVVANEFIACTSTEISIFSPSILSFLQTSVFTHQSLNYEVGVASIITYINSGTNSSQHIYQSKLQFAGINKFYFSLGSTPLIVSSAISGYSGDIVNMKVNTHGGLVNDAVSVKFGVVGCSSLSSTTIPNLSINCVVPPLPAVLSAYVIYANIPPFGYGINNASRILALPLYSSIIAINNLNHRTINSSVLGGIDINIVGKGFSSDISVSICNQNCTVKRVSYDKLTCTNEPHMTIGVVDQLQINNIAIDLISIVSGTYFSSGSSSSNYLANVEDGDATTYIADYSYSKSCYIGINLPRGLVVQPYRLRFYPKLQTAVNFGNIIFEGSNDGGKTYTWLGSLNGIHEGKLNLCC